MYKVMLVDDNRIEMEGVRDLVPWGDFDCTVVVTAKNGQEGFEKAMKMKPDIIVSDIAMPVMNGIEMGREIIRALPNTVFIYMSCYEEFEYAKEIMKFNACGYVLKPIILKEMGEMIKKAVEKIQESNKTNKLNEWFEHNETRLREQMFREMLYGAENGSLELFNDFSSESGGQYSIALVEIDSSRNETSAFGYKQIYDIKEIIDRQKYVVASAIIRKNTVAVLVHPNDDEDGLEAVLDMAEVMKSAINDETGVDVTIAIGGLFRNQNEIISLFEKAEFVLKSKFYSGKNRILLENEIGSNFKTLNVNIGELTADMEQLLDSGTKEDIRTFVAQKLDPGGIAQEYTKSICLIIISVLGDTMVKRNISFKEVFGDELMVWDKLSRFETILDIKQWLVNIITSVKAFFGGDEEKRYKKIVEDAKEYIGLYFREFENIKQIADKLEISTSYLHQLFKKYTGQTILNYITSVRMQEAKKLLRDPKCKVYEVADMVGYKSTNYFSITFRDYTGETPTVYKNKHT